MSLYYRPPTVMDTWMSYKFTFERFFHPLFRILQLYIGLKIIPKNVQYDWNARAESFVIFTAGLFGETCMKAKIFIFE